MSFTADELERYARHLVLREVGGPGQQKLKAARVLVVGAGGLGCPALQYMAAAGVGCLGIVDDDQVSLSNLQRQILFGTDDIGRLKVDAAATALTALNPDIRIQTYPARLSDENGADILSHYDLVLDGSDNFETRYLVNRLCTMAGIPLISGALSQWEGQLSLYHPVSGGPCYACVFPNPPAPGMAPSCAEAGVMGPLPGVMGAMMAGEAVKWITGAGQTAQGTLLIWDMLYSEARRIALDMSSPCTCFEP